MARTKLNIPKDKSNRFEQVDFVNDMTPLQLKVLILRVWNNFQDLATALDKNRPDISNIIDMILDGQAWKEKVINEPSQYFIHNGELIEYNSTKNHFRVFNPQNNNLSEPVPAATHAQMNEMLVNHLKKKTK